MVMANLDPFLEALRDRQISPQSFVETQKASNAFCTKKCKAGYLWMLHKFSFIADMSLIFLEGSHSLGVPCLRIIDSSYSLFISSALHEKKRSIIYSVRGIVTPSFGISLRLCVDKGLEGDTRNHP